MRAVERAGAAALPMMVACGPEAIVSGDEGEAESEVESGPHPTTTSTDESGSTETGDEDSALDCWELVESGNFSDVLAFENDQALLVGPSGLVRVDGDTTTWLSDTALRKVAGRAPSSVWLVDAQDTPLRLVDDAFESWPSPEPLGFLGVDIEVRAEDDVWMMGTVEVDGSIVGRGYRFDGTSWAPVDPLATFGHEPGFWFGGAVVGETLYMKGSIGTVFAWDGVAGSTIEVDDPLSSISALAEGPSGELMIHEYQDYLSSDADLVKRWSGAQWELAFMSSGGGPVDTSASFTAASGGHWWLGQSGRGIGTLIDGEFVWFPLPPDGPLRKPYATPQGLIVTQYEAVYRATSACLFDTQN